MCTRYVLRMEKCTVASTEVGGHLLRSGSKSSSLISCIIHVSSLTISVSFWVVKMCKILRENTLKRPIPSFFKEPGKHVFFCVCDCRIFLLDNLMVALRPRTCLYQQPRSMKRMIVSIMGLVTIGSGSETSLSPTYSISRDLNDTD